MISEPGLQTDSRRNLPRLEPFRGLGPLGFLEAPTCRNVFNVVRVVAALAPLAGKSMDFSGAAWRDSMRPMQKVGDIGFSEKDGPKFLAYCLQGRMMSKGDWRSLIFRLRNHVAGCTSQGILPLWPGFSAHFGASFFRVQLKASS